MVKSGEVYSKPFLNLVDGYLYDDTKRPRNISVPSITSCGLLTFFQSLIWDNLKKVLPGFIQGLDKDALL